MSKQQRTDRPAESASATALVEPAEAPEAAPPSRVLSQDEKKAMLAKYAAQAAEWDEKEKERQGYIAIVKERFGAPAGASWPMGRGAFDETDLGPPVQGPDYGVDPADLCVKPEYLFEMDADPVRLLESAHFVDADGLVCEVKLGMPIPRTVPRAQIDRWIAQGKAVREPFRVIQLREWEQFFHDGRIYSRPYGKLARVVPALADRLCKENPTYGGASARDVTDELARCGGDLNRLSPCPPPRCCENNKHKVPALKARKFTYVRVRHTHPTGDAVAPGTIQWVTEQRAAELVTIDRAKIIHDDVELMSDGALKALATAERCVGPGQFYMITPSGEKVPAC